MSGTRFFSRSVVKVVSAALAGFLFLAPNARSTESTAANREGDVWRKLARMPTARLFAGAAAVHGRLYVIGGCIIQDGTIVPLSAVEEYTPETNTWKSKAPLPTARSSFALAVASDKIFVIGGTQSDTRSATDIVEIYDPATDCWSVAGHLPTPRSQTAAAVLDGQIYVVGGNASHETSFERLDLASGQWTILPPLPTPRRNAGVVTDGKKIYAVGGVATDGWTPVSTVEAYDPSTGYWCARSPMRTARTDFALVALNDRIVALGGFNRGALAAVEEYRPTTNIWTTVGDLLAPSHHHAAVTINGGIYVAGGTDKLPSASAVFLVRASAASDR